MVAITTNKRRTLFGGLLGVIAFGLPPAAGGALPPDASPTDVLRAPHKNIVRAVGVGRPPEHMKGARAKLMARRAAEGRITCARCHTRRRTQSRGPSPLPAYF